MGKMTKHNCSFW